MNNEKTVPARYVSLLIENNEGLIEHGKKVCEEESGDTDFIWLSNDTGMDVLPDEIYLDEEENSIWCSGTLRNEHGEVGFSIDVPLTNGLVLDLIEYSVKRLKKMDAAMEALR